jgi:hypothetical protein
VWNRLVENSSGIHRRALRCHQEGSSGRKTTDDANRRWRPRHFVRKESAERAFLRQPGSTAVQERAERSFDDLVQGFFSGAVSRRRLLEVMGKALVGSLLASIPGVAQAQVVTCEEVCVEERWVRECGPTFSNQALCGECGLSGVCTNVGPGLWACCRDVLRCTRTAPGCCYYDGNCTGTKLFFWQRAPTRCVTSPRGFTQCCGGWNQYPSIRECPNGTVKWAGCSFYVW